MIGEVAKIGSVVADWLNPVRRERERLLGAIEAAENLLMILRKQGVYSKMSEKGLADYERHYQKRFDAWKDGR
jgi:hypothetical protein